jgi:short-subunit dehydrogenase
MVCPGFIQTDISRNALTGDGSAQMTMDAATGSGMTARECARQIVKATDQRKPEVYIGKKEILGVYLKRFFPGLLRRVIRKSNVT